MSEEIIKVLDNLGNRFGVVIDWSNQNIIPYLQELMTRFISYRNTVNIIWIVVCLIVIGLGIFGLVKIIKWRKSDKYNKDYLSDDNLYFTLLMTAFIILILIFSITLFYNVGGLFQNIFIPELTILKYINNVGTTI